MVAVCQALVGLQRRGARLLVVSPDDGVQLGIARFHRRQAGIQQLDRRELARAQRRRQL